MTVANPIVEKTNAKQVHRMKRSPMYGRVTFDTAAIGETKPPDAEIAPEWGAFLASGKRPRAQERINKLTQQIFDKPGDAKTRLGYGTRRSSALEPAEEAK
jgi:hypothetical protein